MISKMKIPLWIWKMYVDFGITFRDWWVGGDNSDYIVPLKDAKGIYAGTIHNKIVYVRL
jgi:hypothetical protein